MKLYLHHLFISLWHTDASRSRDRRPASVRFAADGSASKAGGSQVSGDGDGLDEVGGESELVDPVSPPEVSSEFNAFPGGGTASRKGGVSAMPPPPPRMDLHPSTGRRKR